MKKLLAFASLLLAGCSEQSFEPAVQVKAEHIGEDDNMKITIEYHGKQPVTAEVNGESVLP